MARREKKSTSNTNSNEATVGLQVNCRSCFELIDRRAHKCVHCESYQNWRRFLSVGDTTLTLIVALIAVVSATVPPIISSLTPDRAEIAATLVSCDTMASSVRLSVSNGGTRGGSISKATVRVGDNSWDLVAVDAPALLLPGEAKVVAFHSNRRLPTADASGDLRCAVDLEVVGMEKARSVQTVEFTARAAADIGREHPQVGVDRVRVFGNAVDLQHRWHELPGVPEEAGVVWLNIEINSNIEARVHAVYVGAIELTSFLDSPYALTPKPSFDLIPYERKSILASVRIEDFEAMKRILQAKFAVELRAWDDSKLSSNELSAIWKEVHR